MCNAHKCGLQPGLKNVKCLSRYQLIQAWIISVSFFGCIFFYDPFEKFSAAPVLFVYLGYNTCYNYSSSYCTFLTFHYSLCIKCTAFEEIHILSDYADVMYFCRCYKIDQQGNTMVCPTFPSKRGQNHWSSSYWGKSLYVNEHIVFSLKIDIRTCNFSQFKFLITVTIFQLPNDLSRCIMHLSFIFITYISPEPLYRQILW